jgi:tRNA modification GTPase
VHDLQATLVAIATPPGRGGIGCVRLTGPGALDVARRLFRGRLALDRRVRFGRFLARDGRPMDRGFAVGFPEDAAYTGQPTVELWAHGSPAVLAEMVEVAVLHGAEPAGPGEFTYRALRHGRLDLARAEAVRDLVAARTLLQARVAHAQAEGALSRALAPLVELLEDLQVRGEAAVEFVEEAETHLPSGALEEGIAAARALAATLLQDFARGRRIREGVTVVLTGPPNVGKSSLFNVLLARDRAIVAAEPGTTRDTLEEPLDLDGLLLRLVDTAGLRATGDAVEDEGVRRARRAGSEADLRLVVADLASPPPATLAQARADGGALVVWTKADLPRSTGVPREGEPVVSARTGAGLDELRLVLRRRWLTEARGEDPVLSDARHAQALREADEALTRAVAAGSAGVPLEYLMEDLRAARRAVGAITGAADREALYDRLFATFCIGK